MRVEHSIISTKTTFDSMSLEVQRTKISAALFQVFIREIKSHLSCHVGID